MTKKTRAGKPLWISLFLLAVLLMALSPFASPALRFVRSLGGIRAWQASMSPAERELPPPLRDLLRLSLQGHSAASTARILVAHCDLSFYMQRTLNLKREYAVWTALSTVFFSEQERLDIIAATTYTGDGRYGLRNTAQALYHLPLAQLTPPQAATLVALSVGGDTYSQHPELLEKASAQLLADYQNGAR